MFEESRNEKSMNHIRHIRSHKKAGAGAVAVGRGRFNSLKFEV
jgi:hypothetical protein